MTVFMEDTYQQYCQTSNISHTFVGQKIVDHSDVVGASLSVLLQSLFLP